MNRSHHWALVLGVGASLALLWLVANWGDRAKGPDVAVPPTTPDETRREPGLEPVLAGSDLAHEIHELGPMQPTEGPGRADDADGQWVVRGLLSVPEGLREVPAKVAIMVADSGPAGMSRTQRTFEVRDGVGHLKVAGNQAGTLWIEVLGRVLPSPRGLSVLPGQEYDLGSLDLTGRVIRGVVQDESGTARPGVELLIGDPESPDSYRVRSGGEGLFDLEVGEARAIVVGTRATEEFLPTPSQPYELPESGPFVVRVYRKPAVTLTCVSDSLESLSFPLHVTVEQLGDGGYERLMVEALYAAGELRLPVGRLRIRGRMNNVTASFLSGWTEFELLPGEIKHLELRLAPRKSATLLKVELRLPQTFRGSPSEGIFVVCARPAVGDEVACPFAEGRSFQGLSLTCPVAPGDYQVRVAVRDRDFVYSGQGPWVTVVTGAPSTVTVDLELCSAIEFPSSIKPNPKVEQPVQVLDGSEVFDGTVVVQADSWFHFGQSAPIQIPRALRPRLWLPPGDYALALELGGERRLQQISLLPGDVEPVQLRSEEE